MRSTAGSTTAAPARCRPGSARLSAVAVGVVTALGLSTALTAITTTPAGAAPHPDTSVPLMPITPATLANSGEVLVWGDDLTGTTDVPAALRGVAMSQIVLADGAAIGLTAAGKVVGWGGNSARAERIPAEVAAVPVAQVAAGAPYEAGVVTRAGKVMVWGTATRQPSSLDVPAGLSGVTRLALTGSRNAVALKSDGTVVAWGANPAVNQVPAGLRATAIATANNTAYALTTNGTVEAWGSNDGGELVLPAAVLEPGNVKGIAAYGFGAVAILVDNTLVSWGAGHYRDNKLPTWLREKTLVSVTAALDNWIALDTDGAIHQWYTDLERPTAPQTLPPDAPHNQPIANLAVGLSGHGAAIVTKMLRAASPTIGGKPHPGGRLTATPGTFSATPQAITGQWYANGAPIAGATTTALTVTAAHLNKRITYRSTATKPGQTTISSDSAALTVTTPRPTQVASKTKIRKIQVAKKARAVAITAKVASTKTAAGKATVVIKKGRKVITTKTARVAANGNITLKVGKFNRLVAKKTKKKNPRGAYKVTIRYAGNASTRPSTATKAFRIR